MNRILVENAASNLQSLGAQHPVKLAVQQLFWLISQSANPDESCLIFSEKIIRSLFVTESSLAREVYVLVIRRLADFSKPLANDLAEWFMYNTDTEKYKVPVIAAVLRAEIISCLELDLHLSRQLEVSPRTIASFVIELIRELCLGESPQYSYIDFLHTYESLRRLQSLKTKEYQFFVFLILNRVETFLKDIDSQSALDKISGIPKDNSQVVRDCFTMLFKEWFTSFCHPASSESFHSDFVNKV